MSKRVLIVAPSWVGDAILSEPLVSLLREPYTDPIVDVLAPPWCAPVYARMRGVARVIENPLGHGRFGWAQRRALAATLRSHAYSHAFVLPNSWKSALIPWFAGIPRRIGYVGEARWGLLTDARRLNESALPRLVDRFVALGVPAGDLVPMPPGPVLVPDAANRATALQAMNLSTARPIAALCPGAEYGTAKRWPPNYFAELGARLQGDGMQVWLIGSPNDRLPAASVRQSGGEAGRQFYDLTGRTDLGTAIDLLSLASLVISNDSGLMHAAAAVGAPLVALFGSSSPTFTPPISPLARIARIDIPCSPCFKRECPLKHFKCMRDLEPNVVYDFARATRAAARVRPPALPTQD
jgi:heptosyltransferase-2